MAKFHVEDLSTFVPVSFFVHQMVAMYECTHNENGHNSEDVEACRVINQVRNTRHTLLSTYVPFTMKIKDKIVRTTGFWAADSLADLVVHLEMNTVKIEKETHVLLNLDLIITILSVLHLLRLRS